MILTLCLIIPSIRPITFFKGATNSLGNCEFKEVLGYPRCPNSLTPSFFSTYYLVLILLHREYKNERIGTQPTIVNRCRQCQPTWLQWKREGTVNTATLQHVKIDSLTEINKANASVFEHKQISSMHICMKRLTCQQAPKPANNFATLVAIALSCAARNTQRQNHIAKKIAFLTRLSV